MKEDNKYIEKIITVSPADRCDIWIYGDNIMPADEKKFVGKFDPPLKEPSEVVANLLEMSPIEKMQHMANEEEGVISLVPGIPSFFTASHIRKAAKDAIDRNLTDKYTLGRGIDELRQAIVEKVQRDNNIKADISQVIVTHGAMQALMAVFTALLNPSDEVIVLTPDYADHLIQIRIATRGGMPVFVSLRETEKGWILDPKELEARVTMQTKAILLCNPCNPTGKVYSYEELVEIARIANTHNLFIITDEMYEYFTYDGKKHISIGSLPDVNDRVISIFGVSKTYAMSGWRIGYIVANKRLITHIFKVHDTMVTCATAASQYAALAALRGEQDIVQEYKQAYERRRQIVLEEIGNTDTLELAKPEGAYYAFPRFTTTEVDDYNWAVQLLREAKVAVVPGSVFGLGGENHIRISFAGEEENLREGLKRLVGYLEQ